MKNTVVQYEGGGYDGCFYEWNYAFYDANGEFHNIAASGVNGCRTEQELRQKLDHHRTDLYKLDDPEEIVRLGKELPISHLIGVAEYLLENAKIVLTAVCDRCGETVPVSMTVGEGIHGCGGIVCEYNQLVCLNCMCEGADEEEDTDDC